MSEGAAVIEQPLQEQKTGNNVPQEFHAMQQFFTAVQNNQKPPRAQIEDLFTINWVRGHAAKKDKRGIIDTEKGWVREQVDPIGSTLRVHIQPEEAADAGDMMLNYIDHRYDIEGEEAGREIFQLDSTIPTSPCQKIVLTLLPNNDYLFKVVSSTGEILTGESRNESFPQAA